MMNPASLPSSPKTAPNSVDWRIGLDYAESLLRAGRWQEGFRLYGKYAWGDIFDPISEVIPLWHGENLYNKKIMIIPVGGVGDNIMCFRYLGKLKKLGAKVIYLCPSPIHSLIQGHEFVDELHEVREDEDFRIPEGICHYYSPSMDLPRLFQATPQDCAWDGPYLKASPRKGYSGYWGLCTQAGQALDSIKRRDMPRAMEMSLRLSKLRWMNLNYGHNPELKTWEDTAQIMSGLDGVVTVDTGVMHLAGAMGLRTLVLLGSWSDWKFLDRKGIPFYPSVGVYSNAGDVISEIRQGK